MENVFNSFGCLTPSVQCIIFPYHRGQVNVRQESGLLRFECSLYVGDTEDQQPTYFPSLSVGISVIGFLQSSSFDGEKLLGRRRSHLSPIQRVSDNSQEAGTICRNPCGILFSLGGGVCLAILQLCVFRIAPEGVWQGGNASDPVYCCVGEPLQWKRDNSSIRPSPRRCSNQLGV